MVGPVVVVVEEGRKGRVSYCVVLCFIVLYCVVLCFIVLCCVPLCFIVLCCVVLCCILFHCVILCDIVLYCVVLSEGRDVCYNVDCFSTTIAPKSNPAGLKISQWKYTLLYLAIVLCVETDLSLDTAQLMTDASDQPEFSCS